MNDDTLCICGHTLEDHHRVWWVGGGMSADECETYGFNETGGMKQSRTGRFFGRVAPAKRPLYTKIGTDENGITRYSSEWPKQPVRDFLRRVPGLRGPFWIDHCHHFVEAKPPDLGEYRTGGGAEF